MSSPAHVESSVEESQVELGGDCVVEAKLYQHVTDGGATIHVEDHESAYVVVPAAARSSPRDSPMLISNSRSLVGLSHALKKSNSPESGDSNSRGNVICREERDATPFNIHFPEKDRVKIPSSRDPSETGPRGYGVSLSSESNGVEHPDMLPVADSPLSETATTGTTNLDYTSIDIPDTKEGIEELCPVCGDKVSGYHYGLLTCESCKGFFKRTVQNKKVYTCVSDRSCQIDKTQRKRCPFCRFQKCLDVGMKLEAVRADRMRGGRNKFGPMYKRDRARKLQLMRQRQLHPGLMTSRGIPATSTVGITYSTAYSSTSPIKEEIQSPFLSSSTSSPDSSPAPMQGICSSLQATSAAVAIIPSGPNANLMASQDVPLWVGSVPGGVSAMAGSSNAAGGPGVGASTNGNGSRLAMAVGASCGPMATANGAVARVPSLIRQLVAQVDDAEWQSSLYSLLQNQTYNQCEVDLFELLCKVLDQNLFSQVDWARNSCFFKDLRVDDQMKLLQHSWSDILVIDHLHQRIHNKLQDEITLPNGQKFDLLQLALLGTTQFADRFQQVMDKFIDLKFDVSDYICLKFIILLNPEVRNLNDRRSVASAHEQVKQTLIEYCHAVYPLEQVEWEQDRYQRLMDFLPELHYIADNGERFLYFKHVHGAAPSQTLLMEMLHTKRR